jgi:hypothetical protein
MKTVTNMKEPLFEKTPWFAGRRRRGAPREEPQGVPDQGPLPHGKKAHVKIIGRRDRHAADEQPDELWSPLHWLFPKEYTSYWRFFETYVDYTEGYFGKVITGVRNPDALRFELQGRLYRRTKAQVLDLPEKQRIVVPVDMGAKQRKLYTEAEKGLWIEVEKAVAGGRRGRGGFVEAAAAEGRNFYTLPNGAARTVRLRRCCRTPPSSCGDTEACCATWTRPSRWSPPRWTRPRTQVLDASTSSTSCSASSWTPATSSRSGCAGRASGGDVHRARSNTRERNWRTDSSAVSST